MSQYDVSVWKLSRGSKILAQILNFTPSLEQPKVITKSLDGSVYVQTIGNPIKKAAITLFASISEISDISKAEADGAVVVARYRDVTYYGYIEEAVEWSPAQSGYWYTTTITLLIQKEECECDPPIVIT